MFDSGFCFSISCIVLSFRFKFKQLLGRLFLLVLKIRFTLWLKQKYMALSYNSILLHCQPDSCVLLAFPEVNKSLAKKPTQRKISSDVSISNSAVCFSWFFTFRSRGASPSPKSLPWPLPVGRAVDIFWHSSGKM